MSRTEPDRFSVKNAGQSRAYCSAGGSGIDQGNDSHAFRPVNGEGHDANFDRGPILDEIIDRLSKSNLGPTGFFVICHSDHYLNSAVTSARHTTQLK
jgi:hypothetical protein